MAYFVETSYGLAINLEAVIYFTRSEVRFTNGEVIRYEENGETHKLLRDYISNKSTKSQLQTNEVDKAESRTY